MYPITINVLNTTGSLLFLKSIKSWNAGYTDDTAEVWSV